MGTIWLAYIVTALAASGLFVAVGWRGRISAGTGFPRSSDWRPTATSASEAEIGDAAEAIRVALKRLHALIQDQRARVDVAAEAGLRVRARGEVLADMAGELLALGVRAGAGGRFLFTASRHAGRVDICLSDDCATDNAGLRRSQARTLAQQVALQGGSLEIVNLPGQGTTMTIRLACAVDAPSRATQPPATAETSRNQPAAQLL